MCGTECNDKVAVQKTFSPVGKPAKGKVWDSKQHKYISRR